MHCFMQIFPPPPRRAAASAAHTYTSDPKPDLDQVFCPCIPQVNFQIPMQMLLCQGATFALRKPMSTLVPIVTKNVVKTAEKHTVIY